MFTRPRLRKHQIMQFHTCSVIFFGSRHSCPNCSATSLPIPLQFSTKCAPCEFFVVNICILQPSCLPASPPICAGPSARTPSPPMTADACVQLPCAYFQLQYFATRPGPRASTGVLRNCKRFSNRSMLRATSPAQISTSRGGMGEFGLDWISGLR